MPSLKDVQIKIGAVKKTQQITKAMNMVATSRLRGAQTAMERFRPYAAKFSEVLGSLADKAGAEASPLLVPRDNVRNVHIVLCTSDRGLCGGFNVNIVDKAKAFMGEKSTAGVGVSFSFTNFGRRGRDWTKKAKMNIVEQHIGVVGTKIGFNVALNAGRKLIDGFLDEEYDEVYIIYSQFISMGRQVPMVKQLLPIPPFEMEEEEQETGSYLAEHLCEPSADELLNELLPRSVYVQIFSALLETSTSNHAAQMTAMDNATKACKDMIENLTLAYNKARQAAITAELMDIVGGAEALRG